MRTNRPEYLKGFDYLGPYRYFLTFCTFQRHRLFTTDERVALALSQVLRAAADEGFAVIAYCFMPDHVHLLVEGGTDNADCKRFVHRAKQFSGFHFQQTCGERLWQRYGYERTLRCDDASLDVARYILENPLRAGLVRDVRDYRFTGSSIYTIEQMLEAQPWSGSRSG